MRIFFILCSWVLLAGCQSSTTSDLTHEQPVAHEAPIRLEQHPTWNDWFDEVGMDGVVLLADANGRIRHCSDSSKCFMTAPPASTFKIVLAAVALQTHVVNQVDSIMLRSGELDSNPKGMSDQSLREAMRNSTNWVFRRLAERIGRPRLESWMRQIRYPAQATKEEVFWVEPDFVITPSSQVQLFSNVMRNRLPLDKEVMEKTRSILCMSDTLGMQLYAKTGWCEPEGESVGWYVGSLVTAKDTCYFATCLRLQGEAPPEFAEWRRTFAFRALKEVGWMPKDVNF